MTINVQAGKLPPSPKNFHPSMPQNIVEMVMENAAQNPELMSELAANPAQAFSNHGYYIAPEQQDKFNEFFHKEADSLDFWNFAQKNGHLKSLQGFGCMACRISCWTIAAAISVAGVVGIAVATNGSPIVVMLAAWAKISAAAALVLLKALVSFISQGVSKIASEICSWVGACS